MEKALWLAFFSFWITNFEMDHFIAKMRSWKCLLCIIVWIELILLLTIDLFFNLSKQNEIRMEFFMKPFLGSSNFANDGHTRLSTYLSKISSSLNKFPSKSQFLMDSEPLCT